jgi:MinD-like ATPase involved in chromosome partitioning or flagellar assembly
MASPDTESLKRLVFVYGDKGGVGKSAFARLLLDIYRDSSVPCKAIDSDTSNADLYRCYKRVVDKAQQIADDSADAVERVDFTVRGEADYLIDSLGEHKELILVDLPARSRDAFTNFIQELDLLVVAAESGYRATIVALHN